MAPEKAVLIVTGAWHVPEHYHKLTSGLEAKGLRVICERLPTNNNVVPPDTTLDDDVRFVKELVGAEVEAGRHVTVVGHSWGGMICAAALGEFALHRDDGSGAGGVTNLILVAAFIPSKGESLMSLIGNDIPPPLFVHHEQDTIWWHDPIAHLYNDVSSRAEQEWARDLCVAHGYTAQRTPICCCNDNEKETKWEEAWKVIPLTYVACERDMAIPVALQDAMVGKVEGLGVEVKKVRLDASHSPFLSVPGELVDVICEVMGVR